MLIRTIALFWFLIVGMTVSSYLAGFLNAGFLIPVGMLTAMLVFLGMMMAGPLTMTKGEKR
ncbi:MAG: hypothetical protein IPM25_08950 [Chloracidobacterium sp.]|nr:hypothetical protein [Chloracidobacterium sp.]